MTRLTLKADDAELAAVLALFDDGTPRDGGLIAALSNAQQQAETDGEHAHVSVTIVPAA